MTYIKKLVIHGFKSFANKTEIAFDKGINVVLGPNGSGKSNVSDALCFVLGRLSIKSMRAAKAKNLLFMGSKYVKPAREASVELVFDNSDKVFTVDNPEVSIVRVVKSNGQSTYKINGEVKTRTEVLEMLAYAGIDPNGFNLVLQGQIQAIVKMHPEERRKIVEEVAGIAIYESRKEKSLNELQKTEERLKEINAILRERTAFLRNLENERSQALKFKELEQTIKRCKASILTRKIDDKTNEVNSIRKSIEEKTKHKDKLRTEIEELQQKIDSMNDQIQQINRHIQKSTGLEQEALHTQIANLKAELEGLRVRRENYENRKQEIERRIEQMNHSIPEMEKEIQELRKKSPLMAKKQEELKKKKEDLEKIQEERKMVYTLKTQLTALRERIKDKERQLARASADSDTTLKSLEELSTDLKYKDENEAEKFLKSLRKLLEEKKSTILSLNEQEIKNEKLLASSETEIKSAEKIKSQIEKIDTCPLCLNVMTLQHRDHVFSDSDSKIKTAKEKMSEASFALEEIKSSRSSTQSAISETENKINLAEKELAKHHSIKYRKEYITKLLNEQNLVKTELAELEKKREQLEAKTLDASRIDESYDSKLREIEEISSRTEQNIDTTLLFKEREVESMRDVVKRSKRDLDEISADIKDINESLEQREEALEKKDSEEKELSDKFKQMFKQRDEMQEKVKDESFNLTNLQTSRMQIEEQLNYLKVGNAKLEAEKEALEMEMQEFAGLELIKASMSIIEERLKKAQETIATIGSINMRALEVYEDVKKEYDRVKEKADNIEKEKLEIMKIIEEIDKKKKRTFMKTFTAMSDLFSENFSKLYTKGVAFLELENKENIFEGGINIVIRLAKGKYFDVTSLSGGEQTLVALSLLFAIQEYKPYHFYIFDEIDAALDKRNSERLSSLLRQYMKSGQYIIVTHNDAIITESNILYGVSMHDGVSKILSLKVEEKKE